MKLENLAPSPFCIIIDTREQTPLQFPSSVPTVRGALYPGDYSIEGLTAQFAVERKSLEDLICSLIGYKELADGTRRNNRDRLIEELLAMRDFKFKCVCVTASREKIEQHYYRSAIPPQNVIGMICSIEALTGVQFKFFDNAAIAARWIALEALHFWRFANGLSSLSPKIRKNRLIAKDNRAPKIKMPKPPKKIKTKSKMKTKSKEDILK